MTCVANRFAAGLLFALVIFTAHARAQVDDVDPTIGNVGILLVPTRPAVFLPNSMVRVYPVRTDALDDQIESFPLTISSHRMDELFSIMPGDGEPAAYDQEKTTPYYYSTRFDESLIQMSSRRPNGAAIFVLPFRMAKLRLCLPTDCRAICKCKTATWSLAKSASAE